MRTPRFSFHIALLMGMFLVLLTGTAFAQAQVNVRVDVIVASNDGTGVAPALRGQAQSLTGQFSNFSSFKLAKSEQLKLSQGATSSVSLPGGSVARFTLQNAQQGRFQIQIAVPGGQTTFDASPGGMIFVGGPRAPDGTLILMIRVN